MERKHVLTIAGSDSGGGAGIQADLKVFSALGTYGMSVITAVTAQNTQGVTAIQEIDAHVVKSQLDAVFSDIRVDAVKIGMVSNHEIMGVIADSIKRNQPPHIVLDPVMIAKSGDALLQKGSIDTLQRVLLPIATLITPNLPEAEELLGYNITSIEEMRQAVRELAEKMNTQVLLKGGHLNGDAVDILSTGREFSHPRIDSPHTHGTGCSLSSAIAAYLALGEPIEKAIAKAKEYVFQAICHAFPIGDGHSPIHHFYHWDQGGKVYGGTST
ncbi:bifunctional hydroxymethylpyrimidine kinase/phosphomethylpyrimidine kinase [Thermoactinomyces sp. DSM 45892]|uniref:bifunctional hydroxymethylpyrimidine kinase/phosphomethylpyrimidine kinase n=1 Tax=Thermoactinomyces sp. DSM 45892 TaxID=1882753 RepID=UPI00089D68FA|nr:bifunctional hydroxymethylpyrimidine kinase/phosphomethylpyrimidine kinase [Thermoactinomyces sp. DSM 45892]SDY59524.1 hydroxymethylpyrimidine kinase /phosphomethylpyrimidine kinase [Thermoactinomyces sp. DSM 45892]